MNKDNQHKGALFLVSAKVPTDSRHSGKSLSKQEYEKTLSFAVYFRAKTALKSRDWKRKCCKQDYSAKQKYNTSSPAAKEVGISGETFEEKRSKKLVFSNVCFSLQDVLGLIHTGRTTQRKANGTCVRE